MEQTPSTRETRPQSRPLWVRLARGLLVGILSIFLIYLKILGGLVKLAIGAVRKLIPGDRRDAA